MSIGVGFMMAVGAMEPPGGLSIEVSGPDSIAEGGLYELALGAVSGGEPTEWAIDWGDGTVDAGSGSPAGNIFPHTYGDNHADLTIRIDLTDHRVVHPGAGSVVIQVTNEDPVPALEGEVSTFQGADYTVVASVSDPGTDDSVESWSVDWGDGTTDSGSGNPVLENLTHVYSASSPGRTVTLTVTDDDGGTGVATWDVAVQNVPPVADPQSVSVAEDDSLPITLTASDAPEHGQLSGDVPNLVYTPDRNYFGPDQFTFTAGDGTDASEPATISIDVTEVSDAPVAVADGVIRAEGIRVVKIPKATLLANDTDPQGEQLALTAVSNPQPSGATVSVAGAWVVYTAPSGEAVAGGFDYTLANSPSGLTSTGHVTVSSGTAPGGSSSPNAVRITLQAPNTVRVTFQGVPGRNYRVQYTGVLTPPYDWRDFPSSGGDHAADATSGVFEHLDVNPTDPARLYRAVSRP
jgi:Bacterial Ig domain